MLQIIVDIGNTWVKIAAYMNHQCVKTDRNREVTNDFLESFLQDFSDKKPRAIVSSVRHILPEMMPMFHEKFHCLLLNAQTPVPIFNHYATPQTLGSDRLAAVIGAATLFPNTPLLVFDAGSCLTWDFIDAQKNYWGGGIAPGINMRLQAVHNFTEKLPLVETGFATGLLGNTTIDAIKAGCVNATVLEIDAVIEDFKKRYPDLKVIFCGGDAEMLQKEIKNNTFAHPDLVQVGLKEILDFNEDK
ncbi:MAG: type III pantothenate kinase [Bacteroidales bacterium]|nr:type III pantothenate kinase [Bacteroidales bacterium]